METLMKKSILVVAVAGLSVLAGAQADKKTQDSAASAREASTGKASGKVSSYDVKKVEGAKQAAPQDQTRVAPDKMEAGAEGVKKADQASSGNNPSKTTAQDDWQAQRVATGDVNGDGKSSVTAPRDAATGMASGKRQHKPLLVNKVEDEKQAEQPKK